VTSPIEARLFEAMRAQAATVGFGLAWDADFRGAILETKYGLPKLLIDQWHRTEGDGQFPRAVLARNVRVESYRLDFLIGMSTPGVLAVECDGHDFHDRTKQQAAYDRARDRELLRRGIHTIRFTGSEITHSAERCATEVFETLLWLRDLSFRLLGGD